MIIQDAQKPLQDGARSRTSSVTSATVRIKLSWRRCRSCAARLRPLAASLPASSRCVLCVAGRTGALGQADQRRWQYDEHK